MCGHPSFRHSLWLYRLSSLCWTIHKGIRIPRTVCQGSWLHRCGRPQAPNVLELIMAFDPQVCSGKGSCPGWDGDPMSTNDLSQPSHGSVTLKIRLTFTPAGLGGPYASWDSTPRHHEASEPNLHLASLALRMAQPSQALLCCSARFIYSLLCHAIVTLCQ